MPLTWAGRLLRTFGLVVMPATADSVSHPPHEHERQSDDEEDDSDGPEDRDLCHESDDEKNNPECNHFCYLTFLPVEWTMWSVLEGVCDLGPGLLNVGRGLIGASPGT